MKLVNTKATIIKVKDLSPTARELTIMPETEINFVPGMFVNIFMEKDRETIRRAFSISSDPKEKKSFTISVRFLKDGIMSPLFWQKDIVGREIKIMGPMGFNTIDKITKSKVFLFAFGIGAGVIKSLAHELDQRSKIEELYVITGNRDEEEILYEDFFNELAKNKKIKIKHILSKPKNIGYENTGHIQDFIADFNFTSIIIRIRFIMHSFFSSFQYSIILLCINHIRFIFIY